MDHNGFFLAGAWDGVVGAHGLVGVAAGFGVIVAVAVLAGDDGEG